MDDAETTPDDHHDVIVVGGGVVGASCAWHLLEAGVDDVLVLEKDQPASKASGRAAGHLSTYTALEYDPSIHGYCLEFHRSLADRHDEIELRGDTDHVLAHSEAGADHLAAIRDGHPGDHPLLTGRELAERGTVFAADSLVAALIVEGAVHTDPYALTTSIVDEAQHEGAALRLEEVTDVTGQDGEFVVSTTVGAYATSAVVNCAGAWSGKVASTVGLELPIKPRTSQIAVLEPPEPIDVPMFHCPDLGLYGRQELNGDVLVGGGTSVEIEDPDDFSTAAREEYLQYVSESAPQIAPGIADAVLVNNWAGRCTATPDRTPLIGPTTLDGFYVCTGFNGGGVARSPFAGKLIAEYVTGQSPSLPAAPYDPQRFDGDGEIDFTVKSASTDW